MAATKYNIGDEVMIIDYRSRGGYSTRASETWYGPFEVIGYATKRTGWSGGMNDLPKETVRYTHLKVRQITTAIKCWHCDGTGKMNHDQPAMPQIKCGWCGGEGTHKESGRIKYVINKSNHVLHIAVYNEMKLPEVERERQRREIAAANIEAHNKKDLDDLVKMIREAPDTDTALGLAANFITSRSETLKTSAYRYRSSVRSAM